ncbi:MAG: GNAT family N-acetyltransferase [Bacteroidetes bacterium GWF2_33_16]|nr:MAG: GNAT family N-acetyltransferase [Bacteroidetes bacterium GWE2_32_14]OFY08296.1 MAG: GNAT family N-acetyltransferase [Bacteroidetes bacterium GWF2_33_16]
MKYIFEKLNETHRNAVIDIYNYYIENSFAAYSEEKVGYEYFDCFLEKTKDYPAFAIINKSLSKVIGFCFLKKHHPFLTFKGTAEITYFILPKDVGKGLGKTALKLLESKGKNMGIQQILASISSLNEQSIAFHKKNGFTECGRFKKVGIKKGIAFDVIWMQKTIV